MKPHKKVIDVFTGRSPFSLSVVVRVKGTVKEIHVDFGSIRIPRIVDFSEEELKELGEIYECKVKKSGNIYIVEPLIVERLIKEKGFIASCDEKVQKLLEDWIVEYGAEVILTLIGRKKQKS